MPDLQVKVRTSGIDEFLEKTIEVSAQNCPSGQPTAIFWIYRASGSLLESHALKPA